MGERIISVANFEDGEEYREINSPRTMEACLRCGVDPSELYPVEKESLRRKGMTLDMLELKFSNSERKRRMKIDDVKSERLAIIKFSERPSQSPTKVDMMPQKDTSEGLIEQEEKRMEALKRRQEAELEKIMEREAAMAELYQKIARAEAEEHKKHKQHLKAVAAAKVEAEKKAKALAAKKKQAEEEEKARKKEIEKKEAAFAEKMKKIQAQEAKRLEREAKERERERIEKMEEYRKKTEALVQQQADLAEKNRILMLEREERVQAQMQEKKERKRIEVAEARAKAKARIDTAIQSAIAIQDQKKADFYARQAKAEELARENAKLEKIRLKEGAEAREKKAKVAYDRLVGAYEKRAERRDDIVRRSESKQGGYEKMQMERLERIRKNKFIASIKVQDKIENVERTARTNEFKRLQTLKSIEDGDRRYEEIQSRKRELMSKYRSEQKRTLTRKHEIADAMETMRVTGDTKLLDRIFNSNKDTSAGPADGDDEEKEEKATASKPGTA